jgi:hypothetical protein
MIVINIILYIHFNFGYTIYKRIKKYEMKILIFFQYNINIIKGRNIIFHFYSILILFIKELKK